MKKKEVDIEAVVEKVKNDIAEKKNKKFDKSKPVLLVRLGDKEKGWIPSELHSNAFMKLAEEVGLTDKYNVITYHYGIELQVVDPSNIRNIEDLLITEWKDIEKLKPYYKDK